MAIDHRPSRRRRVAWILGLVAAGALVMGAFLVDSEDAPRDPAEVNPAPQDPEPPAAPRLGSGGTAAGASRKRLESSFEALAASLPGKVGLAYAAIGRGGELRSFGSLRSGSAWSTIKVALAATVIRDADGPEGLTTSQRSRISAALRASDNTAAMELWSELLTRHGGSAGAASAVEGVLGAAGDSTTSVSTLGRDGFSPYGQTDWSLAGQARFMAALAGRCLPGSAHLLDEMSRLVEGQRWGIGVAGSRAGAFKGGWGPDEDGRYLVRQLGSLETADGTVALAIAALPDDGQFGTGQGILGRMAKWAASKLEPDARTPC